MLTCMRCNWVLNSPLRGEKLTNLINGVLLWLNYRGVNSTSVKKKLIKMISGYEQLTNNKDICRHCLMESISLLIPNKVSEEFKKTFINAYTFNSVIY